MLVSIDPGLSGTGLAIWPTVKSKFPSSTLILSCNDNRAHWSRRSVRIAHLVTAALKANGARNERLTLAWEVPGYFQSEGGLSSATSGSLVKLCFTAGCIVSSIFEEFEIAKHVPVEVNTWKGQLPKRIVESRIEVILGKRACASLSSHMWDAVGIGLWAQGRF